MNKKEKARRREYRSAVRMMIAARHEAEHGRYKKALWMIRKAWVQGNRANKISTDDMIREIYYRTTELTWQTMEALSAYNEAVGEDRRFLKWRNNR